MGAKPVSRILVLYLYMLIVTLSTAQAAFQRVKLFDVVILRGTISVTASRYAFGQFIRVFLEPISLVMISIIVGVACRCDLRMFAMANNHGKWTPAEASFIALENMELSTVCCF